METLDGPGFSRRWRVDVDGASLAVYGAGAAPEEAHAVVLLLHGAGSCALTWAVLVDELLCAAAQTHGSVLDEISVAAYDMRGHGASTGEESDCALETLAADLAAVACALSAARVFLVGHSLGGAVAAHAAAGGLVAPAGLAVVDASEQAAAAGIPHMRAFLESGRPASFDSLDDAAAWALRASGGHASASEPRRAEAVRVSLSGQLRPCAAGRLVWRTDLLATQRHWESWFAGLSAAFLAAGRVPRLLVLASDREALDRALTVAAMRGAFQTAVVRGSGHAVQEDCPARLAAALADFLAYNLRPVPPSLRVDAPQR